jgi:lysyl-tRNA synthetase class 2
MEYQQNNYHKIYGRVLRKNDLGGILFLDLQLFTVPPRSIQIVIEKTLSDLIFEDAKNINLGDIIYVEGEKYTTKRGVESILAKRVEYVTHNKSTEFMGRKKSRTRNYKEKYMQLSTNPKEFEYQAFIHELTFQIRKSLYERDFIEFDTGILRSEYDGGLSKPFETFSNALNKKLYLRASMEISLKKLLAAGYPKVFEIGRVFRNEGYNRKISPEFTLLECYEAFSDYRKMEKLLEEIIKESIRRTIKKYPNFEEAVKPLLGDWERIDFNTLVNKLYGGDELSIGFPTKEENRKLLKSIIAKVESPTIITNLPSDIFIFSKTSKNDKAEASVLAAYGEYISDIYTDENDPDIIEKRLLEQSQISGNPINESLIKLLKFGVPPSAGFGVGLNRLFLIIRKMKGLSDDIRNAFIYRPLE